MTVTVQAQWHATYQYVASINILTVNILTMVTPNKALSSSRTSHMKPPKPPPNPGSRRWLPGRRGPHPGRGGLNGSLLPGVWADRVVARPWQHWHWASTTAAKKPWHT